MSNSCRNLNQTLRQTAKNNKRSVLIKHDEDAKDDGEGKQVNSGR